MRKMLTLCLKLLSKKSRLWLLGSRHFTSGGPWLSWRLGAFLSCSSSMIAWRGSKKNTKKTYKGYKTSSFFCKKCDIPRLMCGRYRRCFYGTGVRLYSAGFGQGSFVGLQCSWLPSLGIGCGLVFAYRRYLHAK